MFSAETNRVIPANRRCFRLEIAISYVDVPTVNATRRFHRNEANIRATLLNLPVPPVLDCSVLQSSRTKQPLGVNLRASESGHTFRRAHANGKRRSKGNAAARRNRGLPGGGARKCKERTSVSDANFTGLSDGVDE